MLSQKSNVELPDEWGSKEIAAEYVKILRRAAAEGIVLLKNDGILPIVGKRMSVFREFRT